MKYTIQPNQSVPCRLPEVGEPWKHRNDNEVYLRISDAQGALALKGSDSDKAKLFYSVVLTTGYIVLTYRNSGDIEILEAECVFKPKQN